MVRKESAKLTTDRGYWENHKEFLLACIGYAVGFGNIWRFPYLCYRHGGGAFLISYFTSLIMAGVPLFYLELSIGQFSNLGPNVLFGRMVPLMQGIGWGMVVVSILVGLHYNMIIAWSLVYFIASFQSKLPWRTCTNEWNTDNCYSMFDDQNCCETYGQGFRFYHSSCQNITTVSGSNESLEINRTFSPAEEYFEHYVLNMSSDFDSIGPLQWKLVLALLGAWIMVFLAIARGVYTSGKVVYFTATFPYPLLVLLLVRGVTLPGAENGISFYITPDFSRLWHTEIWKDAAVQSFYSLGLSWGGLITLSSYNKFNNNCRRDALIVVLVNTASSLFCGFVVFSIAGFMAQELHTTVETVVKDGIGLVFIAYPEALVNMPLAPFWSVLFFFMLITLGMDTQFAVLETCTTALMDQIPRLRAWKTYVVGGTCAVFFVAGLPLCGKGGIHLFMLINEYACGYSVILLSICELIAVIYIYGLKQLCMDIQLMCGIKCGTMFENVGLLYWQISWAFLSPIYLLFILVAKFTNHTANGFGESKFSPEAETFGYLMSASSWILVPVFMIVNIFRNYYSGKQFKVLLQPTSAWPHQMLTCAEVTPPGPTRMTSVTQIDVADLMTKL